MKIGIIGLGLIGGSFAKCIKNMTKHTVYGFDVDSRVVNKALFTNVIDEELNDEKIAECSLILLAVYPAETVRLLKKYAGLFAENAVVIDCCGIKGKICETGFRLSSGAKWHFIGGHPMAGIEKSGFVSSQKSLFAKASMILIPKPNTDLELLSKVKAFFLSLGFGKIKFSTPNEHDRIIAYTSQLAHVVSGAYIKSQSAMNHSGFSAGSYKDMTRVAALSPAMWTELFLENRENLLYELNGLMERLQEYRDAIADNDAEKLKRLLEDGRAAKAAADKTEKDEKDTPYPR